jgi:hypothetical protein
MANKNFTSAVKGYLRLGNFPLDESSVFPSFEEASLYAANNGTAYAGQIIAVVDEVEREVDVYQLGFPNEGQPEKFELQLISGQGDGGLIKTINAKDRDGVETPDDFRIEPDDDGNVVLDASNIPFDPLDILGQTVKDKLDLLLSTYITVEEVAESFEVKLIGVPRTLRLVLNGSDIVGLDEDPNQFREIPINSIISKVVFEVSEPFPAVDITVSVGDAILMEPDDIYETKSGTYISEHINQRTIFEGNVEVSFSEPVTTGSANIYVEFIERPLDDLDISQIPGDIDGGDYDTAIVIDTLNGGSYETDDSDEIIDGGSY